MCFHRASKIYTVTLAIIKYKALLIGNKLLYSYSICAKYGHGLLTLKHSLRTVLVTRSYMYSDNCQRALEGCCTLCLFYINKDTYTELMAIRTTTISIAWSWFYACWSHSTIFSPPSAWCRKIFCVLAFQSYPKETSRSSNAET